MKAEDGVSRHPGITIHKMPVAGTVGGFIFAVGIIVLGSGWPSIRKVVSSWGGDFRPCSRWRSAIVPKVASAD
jgi:hypothetical protein